MFFRSSSAVDPTKFSCAASKGLLLFSLFWNSGRGHFHVKNCALIRKRTILRDVKDAKSLNFCFCALEVENTKSSSGTLGFPVTMTALFLRYILLCPHGTFSKSTIYIICIYIYDSRNHVYYMIQEWDDKQGMWRCPLIFSPQTAQTNRPELAVGPDFIPMTAGDLRKHLFQKIPPEPPALPWTNMCWPYLILIICAGFNRAKKITFLAVFIK